MLLLMTAASLPAAAPRVLVVDVDGMVHPVTVEILSRAIQQAKQENAALVLVRLNTPGGLMDAMRESIEKIVGAPMPVVTFVTPSGARAASAGFFMSCAASPPSARATARWPKKPSAKASRSPIRKRSTTI
ncbi:MAG: hypothetical protein ABSH32_21360 [Bryobacteraceae bacterium]